MVTHEADVARHAQRDRPHEGRQVQSDLPVRRTRCTHDAASCDAACSACALLLYQSIALALSQIWANKVRGILTTLGILIGVAAVSAVIALDHRDEAARARASSKRSGRTRSSSSRTGRDERTASVSWRQIMFQVVSDFDEMLEHCPSVASSRMSHRDAAGRLTFGSQAPRTTNVNIIGVDPDWHAIEHRDVTFGPAADACSTTSSAARSA